MEYDAPTHTGRGSPACTTTASDEAKARMETKAEMYMGYMVNQAFHPGGLLWWRAEALHFIFTRGPSGADGFSGRMPFRRVYACGVGADE